MIVQRRYITEIEEFLTFFPAVGIIGSRQVGKTTLARSIIKNRNAIYLDLESAQDLAKLSDAETFLVENLDKLVVIDEIQRKPELFPLLRSLIDRKNEPGRFIILGSASPELIRDSSESLAGRIGYVLIHPFDICEIEQDTEKLWFCGGYPKSFLAPTNKLSNLWRNQFIKTYLEKDLPLLGLKASPTNTGRLWTMLAHFNGEVLNYSKLSKSMELSSTTIKSYIDFFEEAFLIRRINPFTANLSKRLIRSPKLYFIDTGLLHSLLNIKNNDELKGHPQCGDSWEAFCIQQIVSAISNTNYEACFFRTQDGAEIDLVILSGGKPKISVEIKLTNSPKLSKGNIYAMQYLETKHNFVITPSSDDFPYNKEIKVCNIRHFIEEYLPNLK